MAVTGERRQLVQNELARCVWPVEIDYSEQNVYWANTCERSLKSLHIGESDQSVNRVQIDTSFKRMYSMTLFEDTLYWNEEGTVKATNKSISLGQVVEIFKVGATQSVFHIAVEVVHAKKQPGGNYCTITTKVARVEGGSQVLAGSLYTMLRTNFHGNSVVLTSM